MNGQNFESLVECIETDENTEPLKEKIRQKISCVNQIDYFPVEVQFKLSKDQRYQNFDMDDLYKYLMNTKRIAQLYLNVYNKNNSLYFKKCLANEVKMNMPFDKYMEKIPKMNDSYIDESQLVEIIAIYVIIYSLLLNQEKILDKDDNMVCIYCDNLLGDGICEVCDDTRDYSTKKNISFEKPDKKKEKSQNLQTYNFESKQTIEEIDWENMDKITKSNVKENKRNGKASKAYNIKYTGEMKRDQPSVKTTDYYSLNETTCEDQRADRFGKESKTNNIKYKDEKKKHKINNDNSDQPSVKTPDCYSLYERTCEDQRADGFGNKSNKTISAKTVIASNTNLSTLANTKSIVCDNKWACSKCSYENETSDVKCVTCSHTDSNGGKETESRSNKLPESQSITVTHENASTLNNTNRIEDGNYWSCTQCSFKNKKSTFGCVTCGYIDRNRGKENKSRSDKLLEMQNFVDSWQCAKCSYINKTSAVTCETCGDTARNKRKANELQANKISEMKTLFEPGENAPVPNNASRIDNDNTWQCTQCSYVNEKSTSVCEICFNIDRNPGKEAEGIPEETWRCNKCGNNNSFDVYKCQKCREIAEFADKWVCGQCSFYNDKLSPRCGVCDMDNPRLIKCRKCRKGFVNAPNNQNNDICGACKVSQKTVYNSLPSNNAIKSSPKPGSGDAKKNINNGKAGNNLSLQNANVTQLAPSSGSGDTKRKSCKNCRKEFQPNSNNNWCITCEQMKWFCLNESCDSVNFKVEFCKKCQVKKGSDLSNYKAFPISLQGKEVLSYQCGYCYQIIRSTINSCNSCKNPRYLSNLVQCKCGWNYKKIENDCGKCKEKFSEKL